MANLIAGKRVVPELIQREFTASNVVNELRDLLPDGPQRQSMMQELAAIRSLLYSQTKGGQKADGGAIGRVADVALELLGAGLSAGVEEPVHS